jgi:hypothetical protein
MCWSTPTPEIPPPNPAAEALRTGVAWISFDPDSWPTLTYSSSGGKCAEMSIHSVELLFAFATSALGFAIKGTFANAEPCQTGGYRLW